MAKQEDELTPEQVKEMVAGCRAQQFMQEHPKLARLRYLCWEFPVSLFMYHVVCRVFHHDWVDDSYGGPDSGCMAAHCRRCGYSFHTTLY